MLRGAGKATPGPKGGGWNVYLQLHTGEGHLVNAIANAMRERHG